MTERIWGPIPNYPEVKKQKKKKQFITIAGPCSIESPEQTEIIAKEISVLNIDFMRGGVYRAGTYPPKDFGLQLDLLKTWKQITLKYGLKNIVEILDVRQIGFILPYADALQVGARHMQDYALLKELSGIKKPVMLKRNPGSILDEFLGAAEYLLRGKCSPILIERGSSTHMNHVRWDLSVSTIAAIKHETGLPVIVDASHGSGRSELVEPLTYAGIAAGADGFLIEVHPEPEKSLSDARQAVPLSGLSRILDNCMEINRIVS